MDLVVRECLAAWNEADDAVRRNRLGVAWSDAGIFIDPVVRVEGRDAMSQYIARCQERGPGCRFVVTSGIAHHHDQFHFTWARHDAAGNEVIAGCDTGELDAAGRIRRLVAFFKPPPRRWLNSLIRQAS